MPIDTLEPVAGDPEAIASAARKLQAVAAEVEATSARLRALATGDDSWSGRAAVRARARSMTLPPKLAKVRDSYATASAALRGYASTLSEAQAASRTARRVASRAAADLQYARAVRDAATARDVEAATAASMAGLPAPAGTAARYDSHIADAEARLRRAGAANAAAHDQQRRAARIAATTLHQASREGMHNKSWWRHAFSSTAHWAQKTWTDSLRHIAKGALSISAMAGLAAVAVAVGGIAFPPLELGAGALESISMASGAAAVLSQTVLAATGNASWKNVGTDALAVVPGLGSAGVRLVTTRLRLMRLAAIDARAVDALPHIRPHIASTKTSSQPEIQSADVWANPSTLERHFTDHGADFGAHSEVEYANRAAAFFRESQLRRVPTRITSKGTIRIYDPDSNTFAVYNPAGKARTFFKPTSPTYWQRQSGTPIEDLMRR